MSKPDSDFLTGISFTKTPYTKPTITEKTEESELTTSIKKVFDLFKRITVKISVPSIVLTRLEIVVYLNHA